MQNTPARPGVCTIDGHPAFDENKKRLPQNIPYYTIAAAFVLYAVYVLAGRGVDASSLLVLLAAVCFGALVLWRLHRPRRLILTQEGLRIQWANDRKTVRALLPYADLSAIEFFLDGKAKSTRRRMNVRTTSGQAYSLQMQADSVLELQPFLSQELRTRPTSLQWLPAKEGD